MVSTNPVGSSLIGAFHIAVMYYDTCCELFGVEYPLEVMKRLIPRAICLLVSSAISMLAVGREVVLFTDPNLQNVRVERNPLDLSLGWDAMRVIESLEARGVEVSN